MSDGQGDDDQGAAGADAAGGGNDGGAGSAGEGGGSGGGGGEGSVWYGALSAESADSAPSDLDWMKGKGFADPAAMVKSYRSLEGKLAANKGIEVPGEGATDEQRAAYRAAIGVPETVDGYALNVPEGWESDMAVLGPAREAALEGGMPAKAWDTLVGKVQSVIMDQHQQTVTALDTDRTKWEAAQGGQKSQNLMLAKRGFEAFGLDADTVAAMQGAIQATKGEGGASAMLDLGLKLGRLSGEDGFITGDTKQFGVAPEAARAELEQLEADPAFFAKLQAKDPAAVARHERLLAVIGADDARKARERDAA